MWVYSPGLDVQEAVLVCWRLGRDFQGGFAGVDALDDFLDGFVFDKKVADLDGGEDLADEVGGGHLSAIKADAKGQLIHLVKMRGRRAKRP